VPGAYTLSVYAGTQRVDQRIRVAPAETTFRLGAS